MLRRFATLRSLVGDAPERQQGDAASLSKWLQEKGLSDYEAALRDMGVGKSFPGPTGPPIVKLRRVSPSLPDFFSLSH